MPPSKPQKYKKEENSGWNYIFQQNNMPIPLPPPPKPLPPKPVVVNAAPPFQPWSSYIAPPDRGAPPPSAYNPLSSAPPPRPQYNPLPQNPLPPAYQPIQAPGQWRPELIQTGFDRPNIGAAPIQQSQPFTPTLSSSINPFQTGEMQGPQPRPNSPWVTDSNTLPKALTPEERLRQFWNVGNRDGGITPQSVTNDLGTVGDAAIGLANKIPGVEMTPFTQTAAYGKMQEAYKQLDERRPYGTASVWDTWQGITEGVQEMGKAIGEAWNNPVTQPADKLQAIGQLGAGLLSGGYKAITSLDDSAVGYTTTAPLVAAINTSQGALDYAMTRKPDSKNTIGEYIRSYGGAYLDTIKNIFTGQNYGGDLSNVYNELTGTASETLGQFEKAGQLTGQEVKDLAVVDPKRAAQITGLVELNYSNPQAQSNTRKQLVEKTVAQAEYDRQAQGYMALASASIDKATQDKYLTQSAQSGYKAYQMSQKNDYEIVNSNTTWEQALIEIAMPDPIFDGLGVLFKGLGLFGDSAKKLVGSPAERRMLRTADDYLKTIPQQIAVDVEKLGIAPEVKQMFAPQSKIFTWTGGTVKAEKDAYHLTNAVMGLLSDVDNVRDAKLLLNVMSDSKQLSKAIREGLPYQLFQSQMMRDLADEKGMVHLGFAMFGSKDVQNALKTWGNVSREFLQTTQALSETKKSNKLARTFGREAVDPNKFDKVAFVADFVDYMKNAGYNRYGVLDAAGKGAQKNLANVVSSNMQRFMSTFQIKVNPGSWVRDITSTMGLAVGDGVFYLGDWRKSLGKMYGETMPSLLVEAENVGQKALSEQANLNKGLLGFRKPSAKWEEGFANNVWAKSVMEMNRKYIPKTMNNALAPLLKQAGVDQRTTNAIVNRLSHVMQVGGKSEVVKEFNSIVSGMVKPLDLKQYASQIDEVLTIDELNAVYRAVHTAKSPEQFQSALDNILDKAQARYGKMVIDSPTAPMRYDWTDIEISQDAGEFGRLSQLAVNNGLDPAMAKQATQEALQAAEKEKGMIDTLVQFVTDSNAPNARYALYNFWAQRHDLLMDTRVRINEMAEDVIARGGRELWATDYFPAVRQMWTETRARIETIIGDAKRILNEGQDLSQNYSAWAQLERVARSDEARLMQSLALNPGSAKFDSAALKEVIAAKRAIEDRAAARTYAAARRVIAEKPESTTDVMDVLLSADRDISQAGAKVSVYLERARNKALELNTPKAWEDYFSIRNAKWREHTEFAVVRWKGAESQAVLHGEGTGLVWADPFTAAPKGNVANYNPNLELIGQASKPGHWWVRTPDGNHILMPDATVKTAQPKIPDEIINSYKTGAAQSELAVSDELENVMSGNTLLDGKTVGDIEKALIEQSQKVGAAGATIAPHSGHMATIGLEQVNNLRQKLVNAYADYVKMEPNKVSEAMQLQLYQAFRSQVMPGIDNVLAAAADYGNKMRSFVVPDRLNKTRVDEMLALVMPYHFWFTRTLKNSAERMIYEPGTFRRLNQIQTELPDIVNSALGQEQDPNAPTRFQGAVPVQIGDKTYYAYLDLGQFWPNTVSMLANKFASPSSDEGGIQYALESMQSLGFGFYPYLVDAVGLASGTKNKQDIRPLGYFPLGRTLAWEAANMFGAENVPPMLRAGNEEKVLGRYISNMAQRKEITATEAQMAQDYLRQMYSGEKPLPEQQVILPDEKLQAIIDKATQQATIDQRKKFGTSMTGTTVTPYDTIESDILGAQAAYYGQKFTPENPYGGKTASQAVLDQNPGVLARFGQKAITDTTRDRPGLSAAKQSMYADQKDLKDSLYQAGSSSVDAAIDANPTISKKEMYQARLNGMLSYAASVVGEDVVRQWLATQKEPTTGDVSKFLVDAVIGKKYQSVYNANPTYAPNQYAASPMNQGEKAMVQQAGGKLPTQGMNPVEETVYNKDQAVQYAAYNFPGKPEYVKGDKSYGDKLAAWETKRADWLSTQLGVTNEEAKGLLDEKSNANKSEKQINREDDIDAEFARREAEWQAKRVNVVSTFGGDAGAIWDGYYALPKGDARKKYMSEHPEIKVYNMAAWNPDEYQEASALFGEDAWMQWAKVPAYAESDEAKAARSAYWDTYPKAKVLNAWVYGRPANYDEKTSDEAVRYNFGKDFAEAMTLFGEDIWQTFAGYKTNWDKRTKRSYFSANETFSDFLSWWYGGEKKESTGRSSGRSGGGGGGGGGYQRHPYLPNPLPDRNVQIYAQGLSSGLANTGQPNAWRPAFMDIRDLLNAGKELRPERMRPWEAINLRRLTGG